MDAREIRIGNYVYHSLRELNITISKSRFMMLDYEIKIGIIKPIPLTEEWLLKFGFSEIGGCNEKDFINGDYNIFINSIGEVNFLFFREGDWYQKISYVHQLQNLYFALCGKELQLQ